MRELRNRKDPRWSQEQLASALADYGVDLHATAVAKIEQGDRSVTVDELLLLALVLDVSPVVLLVPLGADDEGAETTVAPGRVIDRASALRWVRGAAPLSGQDARFFDAEHSAARLLDAVFDAASRAGEAYSVLARAEYVRDAAAITRARKALLPLLGDLASLMKSARDHGLDVGVDDGLTAEMQSAGMEV